MKPWQAGLRWDCCRFINETGHNHLTIVCWTRNNRGLHFDVLETGDGDSTNVADFSQARDNTGANWKLGAMSPQDIDVIDLIETDVECHEMPDRDNCTQHAKPQETNCFRVT